MIVSANEYGEGCTMSSHFLTKLLVSAAVLLFVCLNLYGADFAEVRSEADLSVFKTVKVGESASLQISTLWETDLVNDDANEDAHFSFVKDGVIYVMVEPYLSKETFLLRRFSADDGSVINDESGNSVLNISYPEGTEGNDHATDFRINRYITDEKGDPLLVSFRRGDRELKISVCQLDWAATLEKKCVEFSAEPLRFSVEASYGSEYESYIGGVFNVNGTVDGGDLSFDFFHMNCDKNFKNDKHRLWHVALSGDLFITDYRNLDLSEITADWAKSWMSEYQVSENSLIVGTSLNGLYTAQFDYYRHFTMSAEPFVPVNFCFQPFSIGDFEFFCKTGSFSENEGVNFDIVRWEDRTSPLAFETLFSAPENKFVYPSKFYKNVMAQYLLTDPEVHPYKENGNDEKSDSSTSTEKDIYLYSPSSGIAKYHLTLTTESTGIMALPDADSETDILTYADNRLVVNGLPRDISIYNLSGSLVRHFEDVSSAGIGDLGSGIYVAVCGSRTLKITIK